MTPLIECVPNFSEGRDRQVIAALKEAVRGVRGVHLLDVHADHWHHRSVFTFVGPPEAVLEAAYRAACVATDRIDLRAHEGAHPRIGATDVVPFVPLEDGAMRVCVDLAMRLADRIGSELGIPVFLYARAASRPEREQLPAIRRGETERLEQRISSDPSMRPDRGPSHLHPTAGAVAVGAREILVAFNVDLDTPDTGIARDIASQIRSSSGGFPHVQARGLLVDGRAQVSMNLSDIDVTSPLTVFDAIAAKAAEHGVRIAKSEVVGLMPERAIVRAGLARLALPDAAARTLLETRVREVQSGGYEPWVERLAADTPVPAGGAASALTGVLAAALSEMVGKLFARKVAREGSPEGPSEMAERAHALRQTLTRLAAADEYAYRRFMAARSKEPADYDAALASAVEVPLETARAAAEVARIARDLALRGPTSTASDAATAVLLAQAAVRGAVCAMEVNVTLMNQPGASVGALEEARQLAAETEAAADAAIRPAATPRRARRPS